jgi:glycine cleavage system H protein
MSYPTDLRYTKDHEWVRLNGDVAEVGITDYAQQQLGDVVYVDLPAVNTKLDAGSAFGTIESVKAVSELFAPVSGVVVELNGALKDHPEHVNSAPHQTWMIRIKLDDASAAAGLMDAAAYEATLS